MTTLLVDFNMVDEAGQIPALLIADQGRRLSPGTKVIAADGEGTECQAVITEVASRYALLAPLGGTWRRDSSLRPRANLLA